MINSVNGVNIKMYSINMCIERHMYIDDLNIDCLNVEIDICMHKYNIWPFLEKT